jgi:hypothetical protein
MARVRPEQLFGILSTENTGSQSFSGSLTTTDGTWNIAPNGTITAVVFSGSFFGDGSGLTNITGLDTNSPWIISGGTLYTSQSYSIQATGSMTVIGDVSEVFIVKSISDTQDLFKVMDSGITQFYVHSTDPTVTADLGQMYFTSQSVYLGLE